MKKLYALILLSPMVWLKSNLTVGEEVELEAEEYLALIEKGIAKPKDKEEYESLKAEYEAKKVEAEARQVKAYAILEQEKLKESVVQLAKELGDTLELIEDEEFIDKYISNKSLEESFSAEREHLQGRLSEVTKANASLIVERDDLQNRLESIVEDIASLPLRELRAKYKREEKE